MPQPFFGRYDPPTIHLHAIDVRSTHKACIPGPRLKGLTKSMGITDQAAIGCAGFNHAGIVVPFYSGWGVSKINL